MKEIIASTFFTIRFTHVVFPQFPIVNPNIEQHNLENKGLENDELEG
jgi:hypothetical protein